MSITRGYHIGQIRKLPGRRLQCVFVEQITPGDSEHLASFEAFEGIQPADEIGVVTENASISPGNHEVGFGGIELVL